MYSDKIVITKITHNIRHTHTHTHTHAHTYTHTHTQIHACTHVYKRMHTFNLMHVQKSTYTYTQKPQTYTQIQAYRHAHARTCIHTQTYAHTLKNYVIFIILEMVQSFGYCNLLVIAIFWLLSSHQLTWRHFASMVNMWFKLNISDTKGPYISYSVYVIKIDVKFILFI